MKAYCLNNISKVALDTLTSSDKVVSAIEEADSVLVRSAKMHEMALPSGVLAVARAGAGVNNIPLNDYAEKGVVVFNTPGANANAVKELVLAGMLLAARNIPKAVRHFLCKYFLIILHRYKHMTILSNEHFTTIFIYFS